MERWLWWKRFERGEICRVLHEEGSLDTTRLSLSWVNRNTGRAALPSLISREKLPPLETRVDLVFVCRSSIEGDPDIDRSRHARKHLVLGSRGNANSPLCACTGLFIAYGRGKVCKLGRSSFVEELVRSGTVAFRACASGRHTELHLGLHSQP